MSIQMNSWKEAKTSHLLNSSTFNSTVPEKSFNLLQPKFVFSKSLRMQFYMHIINTKDDYIFNWKSIHYIFPFLSSYILAHLLFINVSILFFQFF